MVDQETKTYKVYFQLHITKEDEINALSKKEAKEILISQPDLWEMARTIETEIKNIVIKEG